MLKNIDRLYSFIVGVILLNSTFAEECKIPSPSLTGQNKFSPFISSIVQWNYSRESQSSICKNIQVPCQVSGFDSISDIILIGENHYDDLSQSLKEKLFKKGVENQFEIATEVGVTGAAYPWSKTVAIDGEALPNLPNIHGIDSPILTGVSYAYILSMIHAMSDQDKSVDSSEQVLKKVQELSAVNPLFRGSLDAFNKSQKSPRSKSEQRAHVQRLLDRVIDLANQNFPNEFSPELSGKLPKLHSIKDLEKFGVTREFDFRQKNQFNSIIIDHRNNYMAQKITELMCQLKNTQKPMVVIVGNSHAEGIGKILHCVFGKKVSLKTFDSSKPQSAELILKLLPSH